MKIKDTFTVAATAHKVEQVMLSEEYNLESETMREGVVSSEYKVKQQGGDRTVFEMRTTEYKRSKTGGLDKSGTTNTILTFTYQKRDRELKWIYGNASGSSRLELSGIYRISPEGEQTRVEHEVEINVRIPLLGGTISKVIAREFKGTFPGHQALLRKSLV